MRSNSGGRFGNHYLLKSTNEAAVAQEFGTGKINSVDINKERLCFASSFAATGAYRSDPALSAQENASKIIDTHQLSAGADVVIEASGAEPSVQTGIHILRKGGGYVQVGLGRPEIQFLIMAMCEKELNMKGCFRYGPGDFELAVDLLRRKRIDVKRLITKEVNFEQATEA